MALGSVGQSLQVLAGLDPTDRGGSVPRDDRATLRKVSQDFEAIFLDELFKEMRNSPFGGGILGQDHTTKLYQEMYDQAVSREMAASGGLGLGRMIEAELGRTLKL